MNRSNPTIDDAVLRTIHTRRSVSRLGGDVTDATIRTLIEAAIAAPNHRLTQPWHFTVLRDEARARLGALFGRLAAAESGLGDAEAADLAAREAKKPLRAPAIVTVSTSTSLDPVVAEEDLAATAAATQNLLLAAHALGLAAIWRTGAMTSRPEIKAHLDLRDTDRIVAFVYLGEASGDAPPTPVRTLDDKITWLA